MSVNKFAAMGSSIIVLVAVAVGLVLSGPPGEQRQKRLDTKRVSDLRNIARVMDAHTEDRGELPAALTDLVDGRRLTRMPADPVTGIPYRYEIVSATQYKLCARFDRTSDATIAIDFWSHGQGEKCYVLDVRKDGEGQGPVF